MGNIVSLATWFDWKRRKGYWDLSQWELFFLCVCVFRTLIRVQFTSVPESQIRSRLHTWLSHFGTWSFFPTTKTNLTPLNPLVTKCGLFQTYRKQLKVIHRTHFVWRSLLMLWIVLWCIHSFLMHVAYLKVGILNVFPPHTEYLFTCIYWRSVLRNNELAFCSCVLCKKWYVFWVLSSLPPNCTAPSLFLFLFFCNSWIWEVFKFISYYSVSAFQTHLEIYETTVPGDNFSFFTSISFSILSDIPWALFPTVF